MSKVDLAAKPPQILWKLAPPKTKSIRLTAAPEKKLFRAFQGVEPKNVQFRAAPGFLISQLYKLARSTGFCTLPRFHRFFATKPPY